MELRGRAVMVTGGASGFVRAISVRLAREGLAGWWWILMARADMTVDAICAQGVRTRMLSQGLCDGRKRLLEVGAIDPEQVAESAVAGMAAEQLLILRVFIVTGTGQGGIGARAGRGAPTAPDVIG